MKKRILSIVLVFCMMFTLIPSNAFAAETGSTDGNAGDTGTEKVIVNETVNLAEGINVSNAGDFVVSGGEDGKDYSYANHKLMIQTSTPLTISGTTTVDGILVNSGVTANITLSDVDIQLSDVGYNVFNNGATVNLTLKGTNVLKSGSGSAGITVPEGSVLTITDASTGSLQVTGGDYAAGIGGDANFSGGTVNIKGGTITAKGGHAAAGIGGGSNGRGGTVNITGGNVNVVGNTETGAQNIGHGSVISSVEDGTLKGISNVELNRTVTIVSLEGVTGAGISVTDLTVTNDGKNYPYSTAGMKTMADGKLYLWLPVGATVSEVIADNKDYTGSVTSGDAGTLNDKGTVIASVTTSDGKKTNYVDFATALSTAQGSSGSTLKLLGDVKYESYSVIDINSTMTWDLNGCTLTMDLFIKLVDSNANLTVQDSSISSNGKIISSSIYVFYVKQGTLKITGGVYESLEDGSSTNVIWAAANNSKVEITGGEFKNDGGGNSVSFNYGSMNISGGTFYNVMMVLGGKTTLSGGTYNIISVADNANLTLNSLLVDGYCYYGSTGQRYTPTVDTKEISQTVTVGEIDWSQAVTYDENTKTYTVTSADGLRWISGVSNKSVEKDTYKNDPVLPETADFSGYTVKLNADIDLSDKNWTPIRTMKGIFDGAGHSVSHMTVAENYVGGFITSLDSGATVKNLSISGTVTLSNDSGAVGSSYAGSIAATMSASQNEKTSIENCVANVTVSAKGDVKTVSLGGLVGSMEATSGNATVSLQNCYSGGIVTNNAYVWNFLKPYMGALVGECKITSGNTGALTNCYASQSGVNMVGYNDNDKPVLTSVGTYDSNGTLTSTDGTSLTHGSDLKTAMKNGVLRQGANAVNYVTWTTDTIPTLTNIYATAHIHQVGEWKVQNGQYTGSCTECGETVTAEACVTSGNTDTEKPYGTLEEAIEAAQSENGSTVKLLTDVTTEKRVTVISGTFTIDLNGKTWTCVGSDIYGLFLRSPSHVTLKDSVGNGTLSSAKLCTIIAYYASLTIESGTYSNTGKHEALDAYYVNDPNRRITISGGTFTTNGTIITEAVNFNGSNVTITGGDFKNTTVFSVCKDADVTGGTFEYIDNRAYKVDELLGDGYAYKRRDASTGTWKWLYGVNSAVVLDVTVKKIPVTITAQPENTAVTYGYTDAPVLSVTAQKPEGVASDVAYQWYQNNTLLTGATGPAFTLESGLDAGTYNYTCKVTCDDYTVDSKTATVTVNQAEGSITNNNYVTDYTYNGSAIVDPFQENFITNSGGNVTFEWYKGDSTAEGDRLTATPAGIGIYTLKADVANTNNYTAASSTVPVSIRYLQTDDVAVLSGDMGKNGWYTGDVTVSAQSGYSIAASNDTDAVWGNSLNQNTDMSGEYTYYLKQDGTGYITDAKTITISRDTGAPQIGKEAYSEHQSFLGWLFHNSSIQVTVPVSDTVSGADHISYVLTPEGGTAQAAQTANVGTDGNATFTVKKNFKGTIAVTAYDKAGNASSPVEINKMFIEDTAPTLTIKDGTNDFTGQWYTTKQTLHISTSDAESGIKSVTYLVDGDNPSTLFEAGETDSSLIASKDDLTIQAEEGEHTYEVTVMDRALNTTTQTVTIKLDTVVPVLTDITGQSEANMTDRATETVTFTASDSGSFYYIAVKNEEPAPDVTKVLAGEAHVMKAGDQNTISLTKLDPNEDYTLYLAAKDVAGNVTAQVTPFGFITTKISLAAAEVKLADSSFAYNGMSQITAVTVKMDGVIIPAEQYEISYSNSNGGDGNTTNPGTVTVTVTALEGAIYSGTADSKPIYVIKKATINPAGINSNAYSGIYDGVAHNAVMPVTGVPEGAVVSYSTSTDNGVTWSNDTSNCPQITNAGSMLVKIKISKVNYEDLVFDAKTATVAKKSVTVTASDSITKTYGDEAFSLDAKTEGTVKLSYETDNQSVATVSSTGEVTLEGYGIATITISAQGTNFNTATQKVVITVNPKIMAKPKVKSSDSRKIKVSWKKDSLATGYQIRYSTSKKFTSKTTKTVTVKSFKTLSKKISKLKSGKKYYIQIRAFKKTDQSVVYGDWSKASKVKVK